MKTTNECLDMIAAAFNCPDVSFTETIQAIQLDAMREGARRAAEIVNAYPQTISILSANKDILTTADRWTTKDL